MKMLPPNSVCDGEVVAWSGDRLNFDLLQHRLAAGAARSRALAVEQPASYVVFDLLAASGVDLGGWQKFKHRTTEDAVIGAVIGYPSQAERVEVMPPSTANSAPCT